MSSINSEHTPIVSVIIPVFNGRKYITEALSSVLKQTFVDLEILVVDGGSTDGTQNSVQKIMATDSRLHLLPNPDDKGAGQARAFGVDNARGAWVAFIDCDDIWKPEKLERQLAFARKNGFDFTFTRYRSMSENRDKLSCIIPAAKVYTFRRYLGDRGIGCSTVLARRSVFTKRILSSWSVRAEDTLWWLMIMEDGVAAYLYNHVLTYYRRSAASLSSDWQANLINVWKIYREIFSLTCTRTMFYYCKFIVFTSIRKLRTSACSNIKWALQKFSKPQENSEVSSNEVL